MTESAIPEQVEAPGAGKKQKTPNWQKAKDSRGHEVPGLWVRNGKFAYQMWDPTKGRCVRVPLFDERNEPVKTVPQAKAAMEALKAKRKEGVLPVSRKVPTLEGLAKMYLADLEALKAKDPHTLACERACLNNWTKFCGNLRLHSISSATLLEFSKHRKKEDQVSNRAINLDVQVLHNALEFAKTKGYLGSLHCFENWQPLAYKAPKRKLIPESTLDAFVKEALSTVQNDKGEEVPKYRFGDLVADYVRFMCATGARRTSALATRWTDVDWNLKHITLRDTKYDKEIVVDFNERLEKLLRELWAKRFPDNDHLFPSVRGGDGHVGDLSQSFELIRDNAKIKDFRIHDCRHFFISWCVMSGVDFMTIANWVGHSDGGMLIGKVYGHLAKEHRARQAAKVQFSVKVSPAPTANPKLVDLDKLSVTDLLQVLLKKQTEQQKPVAPPATQDGEGGTATNRP